jgi:uncharacterized membrane protein YjjP (DUF1212 family)
MAEFFIDCLTVFWIVLVVGYIVFYIQWKRGKVKITFDKR